MLVTGIPTLAVAELVNDRARLQQVVDAQKELIAAMHELLDARTLEHCSAVAHDDFYTGGKIATGERLKDAQDRVLAASDRAAAASARLEEVR